MDLHLASVILFSAILAYRISELMLLLGGILIQIFALDSGYALMLVKTIESHLTKYEP